MALRSLLLALLSATLLTACPPVRDEPASDDDDGDGAVGLTTEGLPSGELSMPAFFVEDLDSPNGTPIMVYAGEGMTCPLLLEYREGADEAWELYEAGDYEGFQRAIGVLWWDLFGPGWVGGVYHSSAAGPAEEGDFDEQGLTTIVSFSETVALEDELLVYEGVYQSLYGVVGAYEEVGEFFVEGWASGEGSWYEEYPDGAWDEPVQVDVEFRARRCAED